jgi:hypothetical protein
VYNIGADIKIELKEILWKGFRLDSVGRPKRRWMDNVEIDLGEIG